MLLISAAVEFMDEFAKKIKKALNEALTSLLFYDALIINHVNPKNEDILQDTGKNKR